MRDVMNMHLYYMSLQTRNLQNKQREHRYETVSYQLRINYNTICLHSSHSLHCLLKQLHWLPLEWRIQFKLATLTFMALHTGRPPYLTDLLQHHQPTRSLRPSSSHQLFIPRHNLSFGSRVFRFSAPRIWHKLSPHSRNPVTSCF